MRGIIISLATVFFAVSLLYLLLPTPSFPVPLSDSPQSNEKGDSKDLTHQKAYFTDSKRDQVLSHYQNEFDHISFLGIKIPVPTYRLNYPPEEGRQLIQEQIRTSYLEEIVHPFRESIYVNGFVPSSEKDTIIVDKRQFYSKVNVRYVYSSVIVRVLLAASSFVVLMLLVKNWVWVFKK